MSHIQAPSLRELAPKATEGVCATVFKKKLRNTPSTTSWSPSLSEGGMIKTLKAPDLNRALITYTFIAFARILSTSLTQPSELSGVTRVTGSSFFTHSRKYSISAV